jgi:hypothetical protein
VWPAIQDCDGVLYSHQEFAGHSYGGSLHGATPSWQRGCDFGRTFRPKPRRSASRTSRARSRLPLRYLVFDIGQFVRGNHASLAKKAAAHQVRFLCRH